MDLLIQLILGALGGNLGGMLLKNFSLGTLGNSIAGIVGGGLGGQLLGPALMGAMGSTGGGIASGGIGGIVVMLIVGFVKSMMAKK